MGTRDRNGRIRLAWWLIAFVSIAATTVAYRLAPDWTARMRTVSFAAAVIAIIWLWTPACRRWLARHRNRTP